MLDLRMRPTRCIRSMFLLVLILFVLLNMHVLMNFEAKKSTSMDHSFLNRLRNQQNIEHAHVQNDRMQIVSDINESKVEFLMYPNQYNRTFNSGSVQESNLTQIKMEIDRINQEQYIHNLNKFGLKLKSDSIVIVVQVHDRTKLLSILLESLKAVRKIEETLVIFSHDYYSDDINKLIQSISFCPVLQIFFPVNAQLHPKEFPGEHPNDCPRNVKKEQAIKMKCNNWEHPDKYGHYREAKYCQTKHHWFWKLYRVFDGLEVTRNYTGQILLLEEDYYVAPDIITTLQMMQSLKRKECKDCRMLTAGNYDKTQSYVANSGKVELAHWISSRHNMGMIFARDLWTEIKKCAKEFCNFDDYNWDWTLQHLSMKCIPGQIKVLKMKATRIFHMGDCGVHHKGKNCNPDIKRKQVESIINSNRQHLFPNVISIQGTSRFKLRDPKPNGGWGDIRDRELCMSFMKTNV
ncbi:hypothetical protein FSP39_019233 [Pinctada imbricata]|uniref:Alpha-1,6-mannosyl-glycoprotein 2-beta-N-acetylglucosaminyltransferase n=1 Tax=Pinctada imbricata TaxID=66713 RepID=A0AA89C5S0_PINIB|nr:hypothetical protein FSP39_019233 [Pinctada imbricata]